MSNDYTLDDLVIAIQHKIAYQTHTSMMGSIVKYYPSTQTADVQPLTMGVLWHSVVVDDVPVGQKTYFRYDVIRNVPVNFPGGQNWSVTWPLGQGDTVMLVFNEDSIADMLVSGEESQQVDVARHSLSHATCYPIKLATNKAPSSDPVTAGNTKMMVGKANGTQIVIDDSGGIVTVTAANGVNLGTGASEYVALASKVETELSKIANAFATFVPGTGGASFPDPYTAPSSGVTAAAITKAK